MNPVHDPLRGRRLRILHVAACPFPSSQGTQVYIQGLAQAQALRGHTVTVLCYAHGEALGDVDFRVVRVPGIPGYQKMRSGPDFVKPLLDVGLAAAVAGLDADVVHAHNVEAPIAAKVAGLLRRRPVLYSVHTAMREELPTYFRGRLARRLAGRLGTMLDHHLPPMADAVMTLSARHAELLRRRGVTSVRHVPPGVSLSALQPAIPLTLPAGPWVVYAGNPDSYQNLHVLFSAMERLPDVGLLLVGASPFPPTPNIRRRHWVQTSDFSLVRRCLAAADVAALPRSVCSGYPIKLLNYLGMGLPTVAARGAAAALPGMLVVDDDDVECFANGIRQLVDDPQLRIQMGQAARHHVHSSCSWEHRIVDVEQIYAEMMGID